MDCHLNVTRKANRQPLNRRTLLTQVCAGLAAATFAGIRVCDAKSLVYPDTMSEIDEQIRQAVTAAINVGETSGMVVCIGNAETIRFHEAFGFRQRTPHFAAMTLETLFDLASLTKPLATGLGIMKLAELGELEIDAPAQRYLPSFQGNGKEEITLQQLLIHTSGLTPDNALGDYLHGREEAWRRIDELELLGAPGTKFRYSDVGFIVLGRVIEQVTGKRLDRFVTESLYQPWELDSLGYTPAPSDRARAVTTEQREGRWIQGEVHDPRAYALSGVAGHAGLFATSKDLARLAQILLRTWHGAATNVLSMNSLQLMTQDQLTPEGHRRGLSWDKQSSYSSNRGTLMSRQAFGHGGFTGTSFWVDPTLDLFIVVLGNRLHPDGMGNVNRLAGRIGDWAASERQ